MTRPPVPLLAVLAVLVGCGAAAAALPAPGSWASQDGRTAAVVGASAICPELRQGPLVSTRVSAGVAHSPGAAGPSSGQLLAQPLLHRGPAIAVPVDGPGQVAVGVAGTVTGDALDVEARGPLAAGLEVEQVTRSETPAARGLAGVRCQPPSTDAWFVGGATGVGDALTLLLINPDDTPALADVVVWTGSGPADPRPGEGITVPGGQRVAVSLDQLAPDQQRLALHVVVQRGRLAAALHHARVDGTTSEGVDWVPPAQPPATTVVVPGLPQGPGRRRLLVTNPGPDPTVVSVQVTTPRGQFVPAGMDALQVAAGTTVATELAPLTDTTPLTVTVHSAGGPVLAGAVLDDWQAGPAHDLAYAGSAVPLIGPALITDVVINGPTESTLLLTALGRPATVDVLAVPLVGVAGVRPPAKHVTVPAERLTAIRLSTFLPPGASGQLAVEVHPTAGSGPVYAARYLRERGTLGPLSTMLDLQGAASRVTVPAVHRDPLVAVSR